MKNKNIIRLILLGLVTLTIYSCFNQKRGYKKTDIAGQYSQVSLFGGTSLDLFKNGEFYMVSSGETLRTYARGKYRLNEKIIYLYFKKPKPIDFSPKVIESESLDDSTTISLLTEGSPLSFANIKYYTENVEKNAVVDYMGICKMKKTDIDSIKITYSGLRSVNYIIKNKKINNLTIDVGNFIKPTVYFRSNPIKLMIANDKLLNFLNDTLYSDTTSNLNYFKKIKSY